MCRIWNADFSLSLSYDIQTSRVAQQMYKYKYLLINRDLKGIKEVGRVKYIHVSFYINLSPSPAISVKYKTSLILAHAYVISVIWSSYKTIWPSKYWINIYTLFTNSPQKVSPGPKPYYLASKSWLAFIWGQERILKNTHKIHIPGFPFWKANFLNIPCDGFWDPHEHTEKVIMFPS